MRRAPPDPHPPPPEAPADGFLADKRDLDTEFTSLVRWASDAAHAPIRGSDPAALATTEVNDAMEGSRKPLAKVEGRRRLRHSGITVAWRGTPDLDDWVAYIANGTRSKRLILADHSSERRVKTLLSRLHTMSRKDIEKLAKG